MSRKAPQEVTLAEVVMANNGPRMPAKVKAQELWAFDPGSQRAGLARFTAAKLRAATACVATGIDDADDIGLRVAMIGEEVRRFFAEQNIRTAPQNTVVVVERPQVYLTGPLAGKINPRDLMWVAASMGAFLAAMPPGVQKTKELEPRDWKGNLDKVPGNMLALEALFPEEKLKLPRKGAVTLNKKGEPVPQDDDNLLDAVGIGLYYLTRMR